MNKRYKIIDLSYKISPDMPSYPTLPNFKIEKIRNIVKNGTTVNMITSMHMHIGTHIDFPLHVIPDAKSSDDYTLEDISGDGIVIDLTYKGEGEEITEEDLRSYNNYIKSEEMVFIFTGWSKKRNHSEAYLFRWPHLGEGGARYLVDKRIKILGIDTFSIDGRSGKATAKNPSSKISSRQIHEMLLDSGILVLEEVANLDKVLMGEKVARGFFLVVPLPIKGVEASPCRVIFLAPNP